MIRKYRSVNALLKENKQLRQQLAEARRILDAIKPGDIDALLVAEAAGGQDYILKGANHIYRVLVEEMQEGCATIAANGTILFCNKNFADIVKTPFEKVIGLSIYNFLKPKDREAFAFFISTRTGRFYTECSFEINDKFCASVILSASNIAIGGDTLTCLVITDLTEQRRSERFTQMIFNQAKEPIIACDKNGQIIQANPAAVAMVGGQLVGHDFDRVIPLFREDNGVRIGLNQAADSSLSCGIEVKYERQDGKAFNLLINAGQFNANEADDNLIGYVVTLTDITDQCLLVHEMTRLDRLNLVGEMAAGIGHEVRNPMTTVRGYLQLFQRKEKYADDHEQLMVMIEELDRANLIITEFLSLAKNKRIEPKPGNLNGTIHALFPLLQADAFRFGHEIEADIGDIPPTCYDDKEIRQLILNLVRNAMEAMDSRGSVTIRTYADNQAITLAVQDTGPGIPENILPKIGTPFLTTKEGGTGLGLSVCYRIAESHGARIEVETSSRGTTFFVRFKVVE
ncbi:ATP-binding protein [Sporomusa termitida]|uniref:histidine kinase n=1 Tax=Sporomusa termitida TaxID=2377 RepID=A0A517DYE0_9FIRM|nr:ATP-binding protein [Sporomusa termitida]QDR82375.1 Sporulation kinase E [Sporomusa termitida]